MQVARLAGPATDAVQQPGPLRQRIVIRQDDAPFAAGERFALLEREGAERTDGADSGATPGTPWA